MCFCNRCAFKRLQFFRHRRPIYTHYVILPVFKILQIRLELTHFLVKYFNEYSNIQRDRIEVLFSVYTMEKIKQNRSTSICIPIHVRLCNILYIQFFSYLRFSKYTCVLYKCYKYKFENWKFFFFFKLGLLQSLEFETNVVWFLACFITRRFLQIKCNVSDQSDPVEATTLL